MKITLSKLILTFIISLVGLLPSKMLATTYYISANGNDANNGTSETSPWQTMAKVSNTTFAPGDVILFKSSETFIGQLTISSSGTAGLPIIYGKYGTGALPYLAAQGTFPSTIYSLNKEYFEINDLKITNHLPGNNINDASAARLRGIHIVNQDAGTLDYIHLNRLEVSNVNGEHASGVSRYYGGVHFEVSGSAVPSKWNDILVANCSFHDISRTGLGWDSSWKIRSSNSTFGQSLGNGYTDNWYPSTGIVIKDNRFEHISGNGLIVRVTSSTIAEGNYFNYCGELISGNAAFCFNTDQFVFQFNEAENTVYNSGDTDARGFDSDYRNKSTIVQYNYFHDNGKGGFVGTGGPEDGTAYERFNVDLLVRYNILEDNEREGIALSGNLWNATIHNNVVFSNSTIPNVEIVRLTSWKVYPHDVSFYNNVFWAKGSGSYYKYGDSRNITFRHNLYNFSTVPPGLPVVGYNSFAHIAEDSFPVINNPNFDNPSSGGYALLPGSPAFNVGIRGLTQPTLDYYNNTIGNTRNIGVDQTPGLSTTEYKIDINDTGSPTSSGWTGLVGSQDNNVAIDGVRFTMFGGIQGTRDRNSGGNVTRDFAFNDGSNSIVGVRMEYLPAGTYDVKTYHYDALYNGLVNVEYREEGNLASTQVKLAGKSLTTTSPATFQIVVEDGKDYEIVAREASTQDRSRFNGLTITPTGTTKAKEGSVSGKNSENKEHQVDAKNLVVYPNPVAGDFTIYKSLEKDDHLKIKIFDIRGILMYSTVAPTQAGNLKLTLNRDELKLKRGIYVVSVASEFGDVWQAKILVL